MIKYGFQSYDPNYEGKMVGNSSLSDSEVWDLITYIKQEWPTKIQDAYYNPEKLENELLIFFKNSSSRLQVSHKNSL